MSNEEEGEIIGQAAVLLGRRRMAALTADERVELAHKGAAARWGNTRLNYDVAQLIRQRVAAGEARKDMAKEYGVCPATIGCIIRGTRYTKR